MTTTALRGGGGKKKRKEKKKEVVVEGLFPMLDFIGGCSNLYGNLV